MFGNEGAKIIRKHVETNLLHYEYLKLFVLKVQRGTVDAD